MSKLPFALAGLFAALAVFILVGRSGLQAPEGIAPQSAAEPSAGALRSPAPQGPAPAAVLAASVDRPDDEITIFKSPTCGCCGEWAKHLRENGFTVREIERVDMAAVKAEVGVPGEMHSCHTAMIGGELVEGHVPADVLRDYLADLDTRQASLGLSVPGMPIGSPGMEMPGQPADPYDVVAFSSDGSARVFASR
jgi:hypothetical protein